MKALVALLALWTAIPVFAAHEFEDEIQAFEEQDRADPRSPGGVVFSGSSSIRLWDLDRWFPAKAYRNRGFGGSTIADVLYFEHRALLNYAPGLVVFYSGENDLVFGKSVAGVMADFKKLHADLTGTVPNVRFVAISLKPSPGRQEYWRQFQELNAAMKAYVQDKPAAAFVDVWDRLNDADLFADDMHLNDAGYRVLTEAVRPFL